MNNDSLPPLKLAVLDKNPPGLLPTHKDSDAVLPRLFWLIALTTYLSAYTFGLALRIFPTGPHSFTFLSAAICVGTLFLFVLIIWIQLYRQDFPFRVCITETILAFTIIGFLAVYFGFLL